MVNETLRIERSRCRPDRQRTQDQDAADRIGIADERIRSAGRAGCRSGRRRKNRRRGRSQRQQNIAIGVAMVPPRSSTSARRSAEYTSQPGRRSRTRPNRTPDRGHARGSSPWVGVREQPGKAAISTKAVISRIAGPEDPVGSEGQPGIPRATSVPRQQPDGEGLRRVEVLLRSICTRPASASGHSISNPRVSSRA